MSAEDAGLPCVLTVGIPVLSILAIGSVSAFTSRKTDGVLRQNMMR
jgi:hypothetical protein